MFFAIFCVIVLLGAPSLAGRARDISRAETVYQENLEKYLDTLPKAVLDEALMTVVGETNLADIEKYFVQISL